jgi:hypothetical protein
MSNTTRQDGAPSYEREARAGVRRIRPGRAAKTRGFTLAELMVSMVGAMFIAVAVFTLAKYSSSFYSRESRIADTTLQTVVGFAPVSWARPTSSRTRACAATRATPPGPIGSAASRA